MNIVIKGADFSEVAIGNVGQIDRKSLLIRVIFNTDTTIYYIDGTIYRLSVFDVSQYPTGQKFVITGFAGWRDSGGTIAMFTTGAAPTQDIKFASQSGDEPTVSAFITNNFGKRLNPKIKASSSDDYAKLLTVEVTKPEGANSLYVNAMNNENKVVVMEKNS